jgi:hypothetical protein
LRGAGAKKTDEMTTAARESFLHKPSATTMSVNNLSRRSASMAAQVAAVAFGVLATAAMMGAGLILALLWRVSH